MLPRLTLLAAGEEGVFVVFTVILVAAGLAIAAQFFAYNSRREILERITRRFRGGLQYEGLFDLPQIRLRFEGVPALLKYTNHGKQGWHTHFQITWPDGRLRCELYPQGIVATLRRLIGIEDIQIGSPQFDRAFYITGKSRREVAELLSTEVQALIFRLAALSGFPDLGANNVYVEFKAGVLTVTKPQHLSRFEDLERFILLSSELFQAALRTRSTGITFVETSAELPAPDAQESQCQVCGEPLVGDLIYCGSCQTPSHRDCWSYFGGCSTYACGGKKFSERAPRRRAS